MLNIGTVWVEYFTFTVRANANALLAVGLAIIFSLFFSVKARHQLQLRLYC